MIVFLVRKKLIKQANFSDRLSTMQLKINTNHKLITDGLFQYIRHPLYTGVILMGAGLALISESLIGSILISIGLALLIPRMKIEEDMLINNFGEEYEGYQKATKKLIPFIY